MNLGAFKVSNLDEARDQWSHKFAQPEQRDLLRKAAKARFTNRDGNDGRELIFLSGDIHVGSIFDIAMYEPELQHCLAHFVGHQCQTGGQGGSVRRHVCR